MLKKFLYAMPKKAILLLGSLAAVGLLFVILVASFVWKVSQDLPPVSKLRDYEPPVPSILYDRDGKILMLLGNENRKLVEYKDIPRVVIDAVLAAEDDQFFEHEGVDLAGIMRAMVNNIKSGKFSQGGSTITQQVAKSLLLSSEKNMVSKNKRFFTCY